MSYFEMYMLAMRLISAPFVIVLASYLLYKSIERPFSSPRDVGDWVMGMLFSVVFMLCGFVVIMLAGFIVPLIIPIFLFLLTYFIWAKVPSFEQIKTYLTKK